MRATYTGLSIHRCARLRAIGHGGQTLLSRSTYELVAGAMPDGVSVRDLGAHRLRDLARPEQVYQLCHADLPDDFGALRSLSALPNNLPLQLTSFVGRAAEIAEARELLGRSRLVTMTGAGGRGKTRLALQVAAEMLDEHPDGVWWVDSGSDQRVGAGGARGCRRAVDPRAAVAAGDRHIDGAARRAAGVDRSR